MAIAFFLYKKCETSSNPKFISEGVIEYEAVPLDDKHPFAAMAPGTLSLKFKNNIMCAEMSTMGLFNTKFIANQETKTMTQMVRFVQDKLAHVHDEKEIRTENESYHYKFTETKETKKICGYLCKKIIVENTEDPTLKFDAFYTEGLDVVNPNFATPYESIKGMMMQYRLKKFGLEMEFTATKVKKESIKDEEFELPAYYKIISEQAMKDYFSNLLK